MRRRNPPLLLGPLFITILWGFLSFTAALLSTGVSSAAMEVTATAASTAKRPRTVLDGAPDDGESDNGGGESGPQQQRQAGRLEALKQKEAELAAQLADVRREKLSALRSRPLTIGVVGFGRFGQFIARTFANHGNVVVTSRSDYSAVAETMGVQYVPLSDPRAFLEHDLDVIVVAVSILSFESTVRDLAPHLRGYIADHARR